MDGVESLRALRQDFPMLLMAVLSGNAERQVITDALSAGVNGYILKASPPEELLYAIATIRGGHVYMTDALLTASDPAPPPRLSDPGPAMEVPNLTPRQQEVTTWLMKGHSNKQIARSLNIGEGTVKIHLAAIFRTLGAQNRTEAVLIAKPAGSLACGHGGTYPSGEAKKSWFPKAYGLWGSRAEWVKVPLGLLGQVEYARRESPCL